MNSSQGNAGSLVFKRSLENGRIWVRTECHPGSVTVLQDENGADLPSYEAFFYGKPSQERIVIEYDQKPAELTDAYLIGFNDSLSSNVSIKDYLLQNGYTESEIPEIFTTYELDKVHYLPCAHLPQMPQRMVMILAALRSTKTALVLKDPFMPFSGRWREHFAKLIYQSALERNQVIVCTNLSFVPQTWSQSNLMQYLDVGHAAEEARAKYRWEQERKERELQERQKKSTELTAGAAVAADSPPQPIDAKPAQPESPTQSPVLPESLQFVYREIQDRIFAPLKELSDFLRAYSALVIVGSMAMLIAVMGVVISPDMAAYREKMKALSKSVEISYASLLGRPTPVATLQAPPLVEPQPSTEMQQSEELGAEEPTEDLNTQLLNPEYEAMLPELAADASESELVLYMLQNSRLENLNCDISALPPEAPGVIDPAANGGPDPALAIVDSAVLH